MDQNDASRPTTSPLDRRLFVFRTLAGVATLAMGSVAVAVVTSTPAQAQRCTDRDPSDGVGRGRRCGPRCTDRDPQDGVGRGRRCFVRRRRCTDSDPFDGAGRGRRC